MANPFLRHNALTCLVLLENLSNQHSVGRSKRNCKKNQFFWTKKMEIFFIAIP